MKVKMDKNQRASCSCNAIRRQTNMKLKPLILLLLVGVAVLRAGEFMPPFEMPRVRVPEIPQRTFRVTDFGAVADGKTLNTDAIRNAITALASQGGGRLTFPPGIWLTGPIGLTNNLELHLEEGALVQFSPDHALYPPRQINFKGRIRTLTTSPIFGENLENIAITGSGVMDGSGEAWRPVKKMKMTERQWKQRLATPGSVLEPGGELWWPSPEAQRDRRPVLLKLVNCRRILFEGVTFQNSPGWNLNPTLCEDLTVRNITVRNPWFSQNGDGLDIENCRNVVVRDSRFDVGDDAICLKSGKDEEGRRLATPTENVLIENCIVYHGHGGVTIGSEMSSGVRNVRVNNCLFIGTDLGLRFKSTRGRGGIVEKIFISNVQMTDIATDAIGFNMYYGGQSPGEAEAASGENPSVPVSDETPRFRDVYIENVTCRGAGRAIQLRGLPEMPIRGIHFRNVSITAGRGVTCFDAEDISFDKVEIINSQGPVFSLAASRNLRIDQLTFAPGAETVFNILGTNCANVTVARTDLKAAQQAVNLARGATQEAIRVHP